MSMHVVTIDIHLGPSRTGLTLSAAFLNSDHTTNSGGSAVFTEVGSGDYEAVYTVPDGFRGWVRTSSGATLIGTLALNPEDSENADVRISSRAPAGTVGITVSSPVTSNGDIWITIGDDYGPTPAFQQRITHTFKAGSEPDYTGGSAVYAAPGLAGSPFTATLVTVGPGIDQTFALDLGHATTAGLPLGDYPFALEATTATGQRTTPREGVIHVRPATP